MQEKDIYRDEKTIEGETPTKRTISQIEELFRENDLTYRQVMIVLGKLYNTYDHKGKIHLNTISIQVVAKTPYL